MIETIAGKIDFLMKLTNTTNAALGRALNFDPSYISRIRAGKRGLPAKQPFIELAGAYFARRFTEEYQKKAILEEMGSDRPWPEDEPEGSSLLCAWLGAAPVPKGSVEHILKGMTDARPGGSGYSPKEGSKTEAELFYGNSGKRDAVARFLSALSCVKQPRSLFLYSDEDMAWLYEDAAFARSWAALLGNLLKSGWKIRIIHSVGRDLTEMWQGVTKWLPLYLAGTIEPFYYPRLRDGAMRRTLFIAEGHSAILSSSILGQADRPLNILLRDKTAVHTLEQEFSAFLSLCRPLMETARPAAPREAAPLIRLFLDTPGRALAARENDYILFFREKLGALIIKTNAPFLIFTIREERLSAAMEEYLHNLDSRRDTQTILAELEAYLGES